MLKRVDKMRDLKISCSMLSIWSYVKLYGGILRTLGWFLFY